MVALNEQCHHQGAKARSRFRNGSEAARSEKSLARRTADILSPRRRRDTSISPGFQNRPLVIDHCSLIIKRSADAYGSTLIFTAPGPDGLWFTDDDVQSSYGANEIIFCGYRFDPETQNYYVRNRTYNPVLGRWIQRDPIGYEGGANLYGYAEFAPVGMVDYLGMSKQSDIETLDAEIVLWNKEGYSFATSLLESFLSQRSAGGSAGLAFQKYASEIKGARYYRSKAKAFLGDYVKKYFVAHQLEFRGNVWVTFPAPSKQLYIQFYFDNMDTPKITGDLTFALGGAVFTFTGKLIARVDCVEILFWKTNGPLVTQPDDYNFPNYASLGRPITWAKELIALSDKAFRTGRDLETRYGYSSFSHTENRKDSFKGTSLVSLRQ